MSKKVLSPDNKRKAFEMIQKAFGLSQRRACRIIGADRSTVMFEKQPKDKHLIVYRIKDLLRERPRFGCPRVHMVLRSEGLVHNHMKTEPYVIGKFETKSPDN